MIKRIKNWLYRRKIIKFSKKFNYDFHKVVFFNDEDYRDMNIESLCVDFLLKGYAVRHSFLVPKGQIFICDKEDTFMRDDIIFSGVEENDNQNRT